MPFKKGQSGNPGGRNKQEEFTNLVRAIGNIEDPKTRRRKLYDVVMKLYEQALEGEGWAIMHIGDRLDGKPKNETVVKRVNVKEMTDDEIMQEINELRQTDVANGADAAPSDPSQLN